MVGKHSTKYRKFLYENLMQSGRNLRLRRLTPGLKAKLHKSGVKMEFYPKMELPL